jgi:hypothetical protein
MYCLVHRRGRYFCNECTARCGRRVWIKWTRNRGASR